MVKKNNEELDLNFDEENIENETNEEESDINDFDVDLDSDDIEEYSEEKDNKDSEKEENIQNYEVKKGSSVKIGDTTKTVTKKGKTIYSIDVSETTFDMFMTLKELLEGQAKKAGDITIEITNDKLISTMVLAMINEFVPEQE